MKIAEPVQETTAISTPIDDARDATTSAQRGELDLFAMALVIRRKATRTILFGVAGFLTMVVFSLTAKPRFSATAVLLVPQNTPSSASLALQMAAGGLDLSGGGYEIYSDILTSRTVADRLIEQYHLKDVYKTKEMLPAENMLASRTKITTSKEGLVRVNVQDEDPKRAADLADSYLAELDRINQELAITSAGQQRLYFEREMVKEKNALADAEVSLRAIEEKTGILNPEGQIQANIMAIESTRAQLRARQVQLNGLLQSATNENPDVVRLRSEIGGLEAQLQAMQTGAGREVSTGLPVAKTPEKTLEYVRRLREVKFHEALFELLARQFELAKQQESKTVSMIEVLDRAVVPEHKSWPPRSLLCLFGMASGCLLGIAYTLGEEFIAVMLRNPENRLKYRELIGAEAPTALRKF